MRHCASYQAAVWKVCLQPNPKVLTPDGRGWKYEEIIGEKVLAIDQMDAQPAPQKICENV